jgi:hypothetical protein
MKLNDVEGNCPVEHIEMSLMPTNADLIRFDNADMCSLCGSHSCEIIEDLMFEKDEFTEHQQTNIAFGVGDTIADTIGACMWCELGSSEDPQQCILTEPEAKTVDWARCDPLCNFETCDDIKILVAQHLMEHYKVAPENIPTYLGRFMVPLCYGCPATNKCYRYVRPESVVDDVAVDAAVDATGGDDVSGDGGGGDGDIDVGDVEQFSVAIQKWLEQNPGAVDIISATELKATKLKATHANFTLEGVVLSIAVAGLFVAFVVLVRRIRSHASTLQQPVLATPTPNTFTFHAHPQLL